MGGTCSTYRIAPHLLLLLARCICLYGVQVQYMDYWFVPLLLKKLETCDRSSSFYQSMYKRLPPNLISNDWLNPWSCVEQSLGTVYLMLTHRWMSDFSPLSLRNGSMEWFIVHLMGLCGKVMLYYQRRLAFPRRPWLRTAAHSTCVLPTMWYLFIWIFFHFRCL